MKIEFKDPEILEAIEELEKISREKKTRDEYSRREKALWDYVSFAKINYIEGREAGLSEGHESGFNEGRKEIALNLLRKGIDRSLIQETTNLSDKEMADLEASLN